MNKEFKVGLFVACALVLLYFGFQYLKGINFFSSEKKYFVVYNNVDKLAVSNPVYINGYAVGRVSDINILKKNQTKVLVELEIHSDIVLSDSTEALLTGDFLGGKSIQLLVHKGTRVLHSKDTLRAHLEKGMLDALSEKASPVADNLQTTLRKISTVLDNLNVSTGHVNNILDKFQKTPALLNTTLINANGKIESLSGEMAGLTKNLNAALKSLQPTFDNMHTLSDSLKQMQLNESLKKLNAAVSGLHATIGLLHKGDNTMSKLLTEDKLYTNLNRLLTRLDSLAKHFDENPRQFLAPLGKSRKKIERERKGAK